MSFIAAFLLVAAMLVALVVVASLRRPSAHRDAHMAARGYLANIAPRLPFALIAAECLGRLLPPDLVSGWIGAGSGLPGVLIASALGAALPGGPMLAFPLAIALLRAGAGPEALVALITAWSLIAINRTLLFELPLLGGRFTVWRLSLCVPLPVIAGLLAGVLVAMGAWGGLATAAETRSGGLVVPGYANCASTASIHFEEGISPVIEALSGRTGEQQRPLSCSFRPTQADFQGQAHLQRSWLSLLPRRL